MSFFSKLLFFKRKFETPFETLNKIYILKEAILSNYDLFQKINPDFNIFPVLKANAYGHGIKEIAKILNERKIDYIAVDSYYEFLQIQEVTKTPVLLIGYTIPSNFKNMDFSSISLVIFDINSLAELGKLKQQVKIHLKIDTGMNRQGLYPDQIMEFIGELQKYNNIILEGVCTHLSDADNISSSHSEMQVTRFLDIIRIIEKEGFVLKYKHLSNSAGAVKKLGDKHFNTLRLGISLYGVNPLDSRDPFYKELDGLKLALEFESTLTMKKFAKKGQHVSYNSTFEIPKDTTIGIVPVGYYEGIPRNLSSNFSYTYKGKELPILGRICMNLTVVDLQDLNINTGDKITIISSDKNAKNSIYKLAEKSNTISYESFTNLSESIRRIII